jgi:hypothetical protein
MYDVKSETEAFVEVKGKLFRDIFYASVFCTDMTQQIYEPNIGAQEANNRVNKMCGQKIKIKCSKRSFHCENCNCGQGM